MVMYFFGSLTCCLAAAAIFVLLFETPFTLVEKILVCAALPHDVTCLSSGGEAGHSPDGISLQAD
jgi:hypothetical protein